MQKIWVKIPFCYREIVNRKYFTQLWSSWPCLLRIKIRRLCS